MMSLQLRKSKVSLGCESGTRTTTASSYPLYEGRLGVGLGPISMRLTTCEPSKHCPGEEEASGQHLNFIFFIESALHATASTSAHSS